MGTTGQMLITAGAVLSAGILLLTTYNRVYRWTLRQKAQDRELSAIRKENTLLTYGVLACLKGLEELFHILSQDIGFQIHRVPHPPVGQGGDRDGVGNGGDGEGLAVHPGHRQADAIYTDGAFFYDQM